MQKLICPECGREFGTNADCVYCSLKRLRELALDGPKLITKEHTDEAIKRFNKWKKGRGRFAPDWLYQKVELMQNLLKDYNRKRYKNISWHTIAGVTFVLLYVMNSFDLIPDYVPIIGWVDDMILVSLLSWAYEDELEAYKKWLASKTRKPK